LSAAYFRVFNQYKKESYLLGLSFIVDFLHNTLSDIETTSFIVLFS